MARIEIRTVPEDAFSGDIEVLMQHAKEHLINWPAKREQVLKELRVVLEDILEKNPGMLIPGKGYRDGIGSIATSYAVILTRNERDKAKGKTEDKWIKYDIVHLVDINEKYLENRLRIASNRLDELAQKLPKTRSRNSGHKGR